MADPDPHSPHYQLMADVFKSFGHPVRLRILEMLSTTDEVSVAEFLTRLDVEPSHLSHQLSVLRRQRLVAAERRGNQVSYRLTAEEVPAVLASTRELLNGLATRVGTFLESAKELPALQRDKRLDEDVAR